MDILAECSILLKKERDHEVEQATRIGLENAKKLLQSLSLQHTQYLDKDSSNAAGAAISKFQKVVSLLSRTGHARFRKCTSPGQSFTSHSNVFFDSTNCAHEDLKRKREPYPGVGSSTPPYSPPASSELLVPSQHQQHLHQVLYTTLSSIPLVVDEL